MKDTVSSLDGVLIKPGRRVGNTTRIVDNAIQLLFNGKIVEIIDHYSGENKDSIRESKNYLLKMIQRRLTEEHELYFDLYFNGGYVVSNDPWNGTIFIKLDTVDENGNYIKK